MAYRPAKSARVLEHGSMSIFNRNDPICTTCLDLNLRNDRSTSVRVSYFEAVESALIGCRFCSLVCQGLKTLGARVSESFNIVTIFARSGKPFYLSWDDQSSGRMTLELFISPGASTMIPELGHANEIDTDPGSDASFNLIKSWLNNCETSHPQCKLSRAVQQPRPRRLVDAGSMDRSNPPRLVEYYPKEAPYLALSHCWGEGNAFKTERSSLQERKDGMTWDLLPRTFQDAIIVTQRLGLQYVWIDSLCIIQDDRQDWEIESAIMGSIYEGSYLTIAASSPSSDSQGFLENYESRYAFLSWDLCSEDSSAPSGIKARTIHDARNRFHEEPLSTRAWTLQERLLPQRLLTYTAEALTWECTIDCCECGSGLFPDPFLADSLAFYWPSRSGYKDLLSWNPQTGGKTNPYTYWYSSVVVPFSDRMMTKHSDCLPAISAVASKVQGVIDDQYLAGLWKTDLARGLAWYHRRPRRSASDIHKESDVASCFRAPSWSWASCEGFVFYDNMDVGYQSQIKIQEVECTLAGANIFGQVNGGFLRVSGKIFRAMLADSIVYILGDENKRIANSQSIQGTSESLFSPDTPLREVDALDASGSTYRTVRRAAAPYQTQPNKIEGHIVCLLVLTMQRPPRGEVRCFIVLGGLSSPPGAYERIGFLEAEECYDHGWFSEMKEQELLIF